MIRNPSADPSGKMFEISRNYPVHCSGGLDFYKHRIRGVGCRVKEQPFDRSLP